VTAVSNRITHPTLDGAAVSFVRSVPPLMRAVVDDVLEEITNALEVEVYSHNMSAAMVFKVYICSPTRIDTQLTTYIH
jgi:hypothetical protein